MYNALIKPICLILCAFIFLGCSSDDDDDDSGVSGTIRFVNAVTDAPELHLYRDEGDIDDDIFVGTADYSRGSDALLAGEGTIDFVVYASVEGELEDIDQRFSGTLNADQQLLIIAYGTVDDMQLLTTEIDDFEDDADTSRVGMIGLSQNQPSVDLYLTTGSDGIFDSTPVLTAQYGEFSGMNEVDDGDYNFLLTQEGDSNRIFDAGEVELNENSNVIYAVMDSFGASEDGILMIQMEDDSTAENLVNAENADIPLAIRFVNAIPDNDLTTIDIYFGNTSGTPLFEAVEFGDVTDYLSLTVEEDEYPDYDLFITPHGVKDIFYHQRSLALNRDSVYNLVIAGLSSDDDVGSRLVEEELRSVNDQARITFVHASPNSADKVDFYLLGRDQPLDDGTALSLGIDYLLSTQYLVESGNYDIYIVDNDNGIELLGPHRITLASGSNRTFHFVDREGGGVPGDIVDIENDFGETPEDE